MSVRILFVCHGNICRSPMAEFVMKHLVFNASLSQSVYIESCATSTEELGNSIYPPARRTLAAHSIPFDDRCARQMTPEDYNNFDLIFAMDKNNIRNMKRFIGSDPDNKVKLLNSCVGKESDISDPWYSGDFETTFADIEKACSSLLERVIRYLND